jgi:4a-hydroxytetrahydrobiopterin dehydratase
MHDELKSKKCVPCEGGIDPFDQEKINIYLPVVQGWEVSGDLKEISKEYKFKDFQESIDFINKVAEVAESEGHHPDIFLHNWNKVKLTLSTHAINGLSENDFILAVKIDLL